MVKMKHLENCESLFSKIDDEPAKKEVVLVDIDISTLEKNLEGITSSIKYLDSAGYEYSDNNNKFLYNDLKFHYPVILALGGWLLVLTVLVNTVMPPSGGAIFISLMISTLISYLTFNKRSGIFSKEIRATQHKINQFNDLLKNDEFKVGLILAIEKKIQEIYHIAPNETHEDKNFECRLLYAQFDSFKKTFLRGEADINKVKYMLRSLSEDEEKLDKDVKAKFLEKEIDSAKKKQSSNEKSSFQEFRTPKLPPNFTKIL